MLFKKPTFIISTLIFVVCLVLGAVYSFKFKTFNKKPTISIGIVEPLEHAAIHDIVDGFKTTVSQNFSEPVTFYVQNAQNDLNLQRTIIQQFQGKPVSMIVPIGTTATQMTAHLVKKIPIISLAANYSEEDRRKQNPINITGVHDEIGAIKPINFMRAVFPDLKKVALIHSTSEKVYPEIKAFEDYARKNNIAVQNLTVQVLTDLPTVTSAIDKETQVIFVLKDHLIVSGIAKLAQEAEILKIPLMTSDEGSVGGGAAFALGVKERSIGEQGGILAVRVLKGESIAKLPMEDLNQLIVFYNPEAAKRQGLDVTQLNQAATKQNYSLVAK